jgi:hypothetical protein
MGIVFGIWGGGMGFLLLVILLLFGMTLISLIAFSAFWIGGMLLFGLGAIIRNQRRLPPQPDITPINLSQE